MGLEVEVQAEFKATPMAALASARSRANARLPPEVNRALFVRNLPFKISSEEMYDIFGKYGAIRQIRMGERGPKSDTKGTAFVVYEDIYDAKNARDALDGFNVCGRYLIVLYYQQAKMLKRIDDRKQEAELEALKAKYMVSQEDIENVKQHRWLVVLSRSTESKLFAGFHRHFYQLAL